MNTARNWRDDVRFLLAVILMVAGITHFVVPAGTISLNAFAEG